MEVDKAPAGIDEKLPESDIIQLKDEEFQPMISIDPQSDIDSEKHEDLSQKSEKHEDLEQDLCANTANDGLNDMEPNAIILEKKSQILDEKD